MRDIFIELTTACNFNCEFCPYHLLTRKKEVLSLDNLQKILGTLKELDGIDYIMFSALGEPLLHPEFMAACQMVKDYGFRLVVTTNGSLLREDHRKLAVDDIYLSFQTTTEQSFSHRQAKNLSFSFYLDVIKRFVQGQHPRTIIYLMGTGLFKTMVHNKGFMNIELDFDNAESALKIINKYGKFFEPSFQEITDMNYDFSNNKYIFVRDNLYLYLSMLYNWCNLILPPGYTYIPARSIDAKTCDYYEKQIIILANGDVTFCCMDYDGSMIQGNILQDDLRDLITKKEKVLDLAVYKLCRQCKGKVIRNSRL